jgi:hypothetical protein
MDRQEHIHIIGAGEQIEAACAAAIRDLQDITYCLSQSLSFNRLCEDS